MATGTGGLTFTIGLNATGFVEGLTRAEQQTQRFAANFARSMRQTGRDASSSMQFLTGALKGGIQALAAGLTVGALASFSKGVIDAGDHLFDLSKRTGATVEDLNGLGYAFKISGASAEAFEKGMLGLNKAISDAGRNQTGETAQLFKALGLDEASKGLGTATEAMVKLADAFPRLSDADKAAVAMKLLRDRAGELIPAFEGGAASMRKLVAEGQRLNPMTTEGARLANEFNDEMDKLALSIKGGFLPALNAVLPVLNRFLIGLSEGQRLGLSFWQSLSFKADTSQLPRLEAELDSFTKKQNLATRAINLFRGGTDAIIEEKQREINALKALDKERINSAKEAAEFTAKNAKAGQIKLPVKIDKAASQVDRDDPTKKILEGQIKELERTLKREKDILEDRAHFLQENYQDNNVAIRAYFDERKAILDQGVQQEIAAIDGQIAALKKFQSQPLISQRDHADAENKIAEAIDRRAEVQRNASTKGKDLMLEEARATRQFQTALDQVTLSLMEMKGENVAAAGFGFDIQNAEAIKLNAAMAQSLDLGERIKGLAAQADQADLRKRIEDQARLNKATEDYSMTLDKLGIAQARISIAESSGAITGLEALNRKSKANAEYIVILEKQLVTLEKIAALSGKPQDLLNVEKMKVELEALRTQTNLVADEFNKIFKDSFADAFNSVIDGTSSVKDAFKSMAKDITSSINKIATQNIAEQLFGKSGFLGGGSGGFDFGKLFASWFGGSFAGGGMPPVGKLSIVGERGPELFVPKVAGAIVPTNKLGSNVISINVNVPAGTNRPSASQVARETGDAVARAMRRDG